jgi:nitrate reductase NapE component
LGRPGVFRLGPRMKSQILELLLALGAVAAALAVCGVGLVGFLVWLAGRDRSED